MKICASLKSSLLFIFLAFFLFLSTPLTVLAADALPDDGGIGADTQDVEVDITEYFTLGDGSKVSEVFAQPTDMINLLVRVVFILAGIFLFGMLIVAGFNLIKGDSKDAEKAKTTVTTAVIGFIIMFSAYWIMQIIQLLTGVQLGF